MGTIHGGGYYGRDLSPSRRIALTGGGGASYVDTVRILTLEPYRYWTPTGYAGVSMGVGRSWSLAANVIRAPMMLHALTTESYMSESASISMGGQFSQKMTGAFTVGYTDGTTDPERAVQFGVAQYDTYTGTAQVQFELTPWWSAVANYTHYRHHANPTASAALGVAPELARNAVRMGFTWSFPTGPRSVRTRE